MVCLGSMSDDGVTLTLFLASFGVVIPNYASIGGISACRFGCEHLPLASSCNQNEHESREKTLSCCTWPQPVCFGTLLPKKPLNLFLALKKKDQNCIL